MNVSDIPAEVKITGGPFTGTFVKRAGSTNDPTLSCWFHQTKANQLPHVSVQDDPVQPKWRHFHVTFPIFRETAVKSDNWRDKTQKTDIVPSRYHVYLAINDETDQVTVASIDSQLGVKLATHPSQVIRFSFADMERSGLNFGKWFYSSALFTF